MSARAVKSSMLVLAILLLGAGVFTLLWKLRVPPPNKRSELLRSLITRPLRRETVVPEAGEFAVVSSLEDVELKAQVAGKVVFCGRGAEDGTLVGKGEVLARIEDTDYVIAIDEANAEIAILEADAKRAATDIKDLEKMAARMKDDYELEKANYERSKTLFEKNVFSRSELERAEQAMSRRNNVYIESANALSRRKFDLEATKAKIKRAKATLREAKANLDRTIIRSPIDGRVDQCDVEIGEYLGVGKVVCHVVNDSKPKLDVPVNADDALKILGVRPDAQHWLRIPKGVKASASWLRYPGTCAWDMEIIGVKNYDRETDTLKIRVVPLSYCGNAKSAFPLLPGMFCSVVFKGAPIKNAFKIPFSALQFDDNVFTIDKDGILRRHHVKPFSVEGDHVIVLDGLPEGELVVVQQLPRGLVAGMKVKAAVFDEPADGVAGGSGKGEH